MQIKSIKETLNPNYPTNNERKNSLLKFIFEHKKITLSLALVCLINNWKTVLASSFPVGIDGTQTLAGGQPSAFPRYLDIVQWGCYALATGFLVYEIIFNIINHKKYKTLSSDEQNAYKKKHIKSLVIKLLITLIIATFAVCLRNMIL